MKGELRRLADAGSDMAAEPVAQGAAEETDEDGHYCEYKPYFEVPAFEIVYAIQCEGGEGREAPAEACHRGQEEKFLAVGAPAAMSVYEPSGKDAYQEASD